MANISIELTGHVELSYEENSDEFKEALAAYNKLISPGSTAQDMLKHVAFYITRFGVDGMVEGVGYVGYNGTIPTEEPRSGIMVSQGYDEFDFEIE